jgi:hypothetical protein
MRSPLRRGESRTFHFCPDCGATVFYRLDSAPNLIAVPIGAFADPGFPPPTISVYESRRIRGSRSTQATEHRDA